MRLFRRVQRGNRWWLRTLGAAGPLLTGCTTPEGELAPMSEVTTAAAIPCVDQQTGTGKDQTAYAEQRVFLEAQGWWGERNPTTGVTPKLGAAEHLHVAMCFPLHHDNIKGTLPFRVRMMAHNLPVGSVVQNTFLHDPEGGELATIHWDDTIKTATTTFERWQSASVVTTDNPSGWREFRILTQVKRPDGAEIHTSSGWCWHVTNSASQTDSGTCESTSTRYNTMGRGWYDCFEYKIAETKDWKPYPWTGIGHTTGYALKIGARDGASQANNDFSRWEVRLDPKLHNIPADTGKLIASGMFAVTAQTVTIPVNLLTPGMHHLVIIGSAANNDCRGGAGISPQSGEVSAVMSIPLKVN